MWGASAGVSNFGYGFANPFSYGAGNGAFGSTMAGGALSAGLIGGAVGYGTGWLGDKLFGANTYASIGGLAGGALGGIGASLGMFGGGASGTAGTVGNNGVDGGNTTIIGMSTYLSLLGGMKGYAACVS